MFFLINKILINKYAIQPLYQLGVNSLANWKLFPTSILLKLKRSVKDLPLIVNFYALKSLKNGCERASKGFNLFYGEYASKPFNKSIN